MDQPYLNLVLKILGIQKYPEGGAVSYDDTGWTLGLHMDVETVEIKDKAVFDIRVTSITSPVKPKETVTGGKAAIIDVPVGKGHILLFTFNPFRRNLSRGCYMFVFNVLLNYNDLSASGLRLDFLKRAVIAPSANR